MFGRKKHQTETGQANPDTAWKSLRGDEPSAEPTSPAATEERRTSGGLEPGQADDGRSAADAGEELPASAYDERGDRPAPDHPDKPERLRDITKPSWRYTLKNTVREFGEDQCTDLAAGLTYYAVLSLFPGLLALLSLLGVVGQADQSVTFITDVLADLVSPDTVEQLEPTITQLATSQGAGLTLVFGLLGALWSASGYVGGFSRAMNRIYEVGEGRPVWKLRPALLLVTFVTVVLAALALVIMVVSGGLAQSIGDVIGLGDTAVTVWSIAKWPVLGAIVVFMVALLYWATPNVRQPKFRWMSLGAFVAILVWLLASVAFAFYVANFSSYNKTYGSLAGIIVFLLWLWLTNVALMFGAELDSELERSRELQAGIAAEETLQLPLRDDKNVLKSQKKQEKALAEGRDLREQEADASR